MCHPLRPILLSFGLLLWPVHPGISQEPAAGETAAAEAPTPEQMKRVLDFLKSPQANHRAGTYKACRARGEAFKESYFKLLELAYTHHGKQLAGVIRSAVGPGTPQGDAVEVWRAWKENAGPAAAFVLTDHGKDKTKHDEMDRLYADAEKAWKRVGGAMKKLGRTGGEATRRVETSLAALREIHGEKAWCRPEEFDAGEEFTIADFEKELSLGSDVTTYLETHAAMAAAIDGLTAAHTHNDAQKWAGAVHKRFARILNERRAVLGLQPLRLEEKLSDACAAHSKEMTAMAYFAHESPVAENKTFVMRAQKAGFQGSPNGECIFSGSADAAAAESAWWYSDGHRLINYARDPNTLGLGPVGTMWTLNTGTFRW